MNEDNNNNNNNNNQILSEKELKEEERLNDKDQSKMVNQPSSSSTIQSSNNKNYSNVQTNQNVNIKKMEKINNNNNSSSSSSNNNFLKSHRTIEKQRQSSLGSGVGSKKSSLIKSDNQSSYPKLSMTNINNNNNNNNIKKNDKIDDDLRSNNRVEGDVEDVLKIESLNLKHQTIVRLDHQNDKSLMNSNKDEPKNNDQRRFEEPSSSSSSDQNFNYTKTNRTHNGTIEGGLEEDEIMSEGLEAVLREGLDEGALEEDLQSIFGTEPLGTIGKTQPRAVIRIERDYSARGATTGRVQFWDGWIEELNGRITPLQLQNTLNDLNSILASAYDPYRSIIDNVLSIFTFYISPIFLDSHYKKQMNNFSEALENYNRSIYNPVGLNILHPRKVAFLFLEIEYY